MKDGNEGHGMNKKYEKFKLAVGTTFAFFILVAVMGIAFVQNRYADENILEDELLEIQGDEKFHYVETGITYWQYKDTEGEPSIDSNGKRWNEAGYLTEDWKEAKGSFGSYYGELNDRVGGKYPSNLLNYYSAKKKALPVYYFRTGTHTPAIARSSHKQQPYGHLQPHGLQGAPAFLATYKFHILKSISSSPILYLKH